MSQTLQESLEASRSLLFMQKTGTNSEFSSNCDMLSTNQLKSIKLKLQGKYFDKRQDQEVIIERLNSNFYVQVNRGLNPVKKDKEISFSGTVQQHKARLSSNWVNSFQASEQEKLR